MVKRVLKISEVETRTNLDRNTSYIESIEKERLINH